MEEFDACILMISRFFAIHSVIVAVLFDDRFGGSERVTTDPKADV